MPDFGRLTGLKSSDRSELDKKGIENLRKMNEARNPAYNVGASSQPYNIGGRSVSLIDYGNRLIKAQEELEANVNEATLANQSEKLDDDEAWNNKLKADWIKNVAAKNSNYYKRFKDDGTLLGGNPYINFTDKEWADIGAHYKALAQFKGDAEANAYLDSTIKDRVATNQPWYEQAVTSAAGVVTNFAGDIMTIAGNLYGSVNYFFGYENVEGLSRWENFLNSTMDNTVTRYADDLMKYGDASPLTMGKNALQGDWGNFFEGWNPEAHKKYKELGVGVKPIVETQEQEDALFSSATPWKANESYGYTIASIAASFGASALAKGVTNGIRKGTTKAVSEAVKKQTRKAMMKELGEVAEDVVEKKARAASIKTIKALNSVEKPVNAVLVPGAVGTTESFMEGLNTKMDIQEKAYQELNAKHEEEIIKRMNEITKENGLTPGIQMPNSDNPSNGSMRERIFYDKKGKLVTESDIRKQAEAELQDKYDESVRQIEYAAAQGGINNFYMNTVVNGFINSTLKAGIQAPRVRASIESSKLTKWSQAKPKFNVTTGADGVMKVNAKIPKWQKGYSLIKEPLGEGLEEMYQYTSDKMASAGAEANIHDFIANKYDGDGTAKVGDSFGSEWANAWQALGDEALSKEAFKAGIYGALGSAMGGVYVPGRTITGKVDSEGNVKTTRWRRGLNESGQKETNWQYIQRVTPWRSGITSSLRDNRENVSNARKAASDLEEWLNDPANKEKYQGIISANGWAEKISDAANKGDEFGFRNSILGKAINDAAMFSQLKGTEYYNSMIKQMNHIANIDEDSEEAAQLVKDFMQDNNKHNPSIDPADIISTLKENATTTLSVLDKYQKESGKIESLLGNVDEDTKQSLIYGKLMVDNWKSRQEQLTEEISKIPVTNSTQNDDAVKLTSSHHKLIAEYGSLQKAAAEKQKIENKIKNAEQEIKDIKSKKKLTNADRRQIDKKKSEIENRKSSLKQFDVLSSLESLPEATLTEQDIMNLPVQSRAKMFRIGGDKIYSNSKEEESDVKSIYSQEQQDVINSLINQGIQADEKFLDKIIDMGRIDSSIDNFQKQYLDILSSTDNLDKFAIRAKQAARDALSAKRLESIERLSNYSDFASEMDNLVLGNNQRETALIMDALEKKNNFNYTKWKSSKGTVRDIYENAVFNGTLEKLSANDAEIISAAMDYLSNKGVDLTNLDEARLALTGMSGETNAFKLYLDKIYSDIPEASRPHISDINKVLDTYQEIIEQYKSDDKAKQQLNAKIEVNPNATKAEIKTQAKPAITPAEDNKDTSKDNTSSNFTAANNTPEATSTNSSLHDSSVANPSHTAELSGGTKDAVKTIEESKKNNDQEANGIINQVVKVISNSKASDDSKEAAAPLIKQAIDEAFEEIEEAEKRSDGESKQPMSFDKKKEIVKEKIANIVVGSDNDNDAGISTVIGSLTRTISSAQKETAEETPKIGGSDFSNSSAPSVHRVSISTVDLSPFKGALKEFLEEHNVNHFINSSGIIYEKDRPIYIITSGSFTSEVREEIKTNSTNITYEDEVHMPLILAAEHEDGTIEINGKKYQPLGVLPKTMEGVNNGLQAVRQSAIQQVKQTNGDEFILVSDNNGEAFTTNFTSNPNARPVDNNQRNTFPVKDTIIKDSNSSTDERSSEYKSARKRFLKKLSTRNSNGDVELVYSQDTLKSTNRDQKKTNSIKIFVAPIGSTKNKDGESVLDVILGNSSGIKDFNSRTKRAANFIENFVKSIDGSKVLLNSDEILTDGSLKYLEAKSQELNSHLSNFLALPMGYSYLITASAEDGKIIYKLGYASSQHVELLTDMGHSERGESFIELNGYAYNVSENYIKELLTQEGSDGNSREIRTFVDHNGQTKELVKWQVPYKDMNDYKGTVDLENKTDQEQALVSNVENIYDDNILTAPATSFDYAVTNLHVHGFNTAPIEPVVVGSNPIISPANPNIDSDTGTLTDGSSPATPTNDNYDRAVRLVESIKKEGENLKISDDEMFYVGSDGTKYIRVTSAIQADEKNESSRMSKDSIYTPPSTAIGNDVDALVRALFGSDLNVNSLDTEIDEFIKSLFEEIKFHAITKPAAKAKVRDLLAIRNQIAQPGDKIIPYDITLTGSIKAIDSDGNKHNANIAGTVDILVLHPDGDFSIYDIKTYHTKNMNISDVKEDMGDRIVKYARQLSLYQDLLLAKADGKGMQIKNLGIIPLGVNYTGAINIGTEENKQSNYRIVNGQLQITESKGKTWINYSIDKSSINVSSVIPIAHVDHHILTEKLLEEERQLVLADSPADNSDLREIDFESSIEFDGKSSVDGIVNNDSAIALNALNGIDNSLLGNPFGMFTSSNPVVLNEESTAGQEDARADGETKEQNDIKKECSGK